MLKKGIILLLLLLTSKTWTQDLGQPWINHLQQDPSAYQLTGADVRSLRVSDAYRSAEGYQYIYLQQQYQGLDIYLAIFNLVVDPEGQVVHFTHRFADLTQVNPVTSPVITAKNAVERSAQHLGIALSSLQPVIQTRSLPHQEAFKSPLHPDELIETKLLYWLEDQKMILAREVQLLDDAQGHFWQIFVDATTGAVLKTHDQIKHCTFAHHDQAGHHEIELNLPFNPSPPPFSTQSYLVYPIYTESPLHGQRVTVTNPADVLASPYGWHDVDGLPGAEYTDTRGNNATVQEDRNANDGIGEKSEGGQDLNFSFEMDFNRAPDANLQASMTNTFYWVNVNHDVFYQYGFDESAGNFQVNNYGRPGLSNDMVIADVQDGRENNNARFYTYPDGRSGRMELYLWGDNQGLLQVNAPSGDTLSIIGVESGFSDNNKLSTKGPVYATLVKVEDQDGNHLACRNLSSVKNGADLKGKIVLIDRGECLFIEKVHYMQTLGALAVIMVNNVTGPAITMGGQGDNITIPAMMVTLDEGNLLRNWLSRGEVTIVLQKYISTTSLDSGLDNLIISHEYGHGISTRLAGGPSVTSCLNNDEQMGEGWSDYFGLMLTTPWASAQPADRRGVGNYLTRQNTGGQGIRPYPYSYDLTINKLKYSDLPNLSIPHGVGAVWASMLWDMTWEIIAQEGVSTNIYRGKGGNNIALQLVIDALKIQPCSPGFVDGRDAILEADRIRYGSRHHYAIWKAFARRGLGYKASQGSSGSTTDGQEAFDLPASVLTKTEKFAAQDSVNRIILSWIAVQEIANEAYLIERSTNGINFNPIGTVAGLEFSTTPRSIVFYDLQVQPGVLYTYRLKQLNTTGVKQTIGEVTAIILEVKDMLVFPNPARGTTQLVVNERFSGPAQIMLFNPAGQLLKSWVLNDAALLHDRFTLELQGLADGLLIIQVVTPQEKISTKLTLVH